MPIVNLVQFLLAAAIAAALYNQFAGPAIALAVVFVLVTLLFPKRPL